eukprot:7318197-Prymnesium_polylepis.1
MLPSAQPRLTSTLSPCKTHGARHDRPLCRAEGLPCAATFARAPPRPHSTLGRGPAQCQRSGVWAHATHGQLRAAGARPGLLGRQAASRGVVDDLKQAIGPGCRPAVPDSTGGIPAARQLEPAQA